jgi:hypothetical protein
LEIWIDTNEKSAKINENSTGLILRLQPPGFCNTFLSFYVASKFFLGNISPKPNKDIGECSMAITIHTI